jgi:hypothetical protein
MYRVDLAGVVHRVMDVLRGPYAARGARGDYSHWTPMCQPNEDWLILRDSASNGPTTCFWCMSGERFQ